MGNKLVLHQVVLFSVLSILSVIRLLLGSFSFDTSLIWWWLGGIIGFLFVFSDRLVHALVTNSDEVLSLRIKDLFSKGKLAEGMAVALSERDKQKNLVMRSALFIVIWAGISIFATTSVASPFSRGFVLGVGTHLIFDLAWDFFFAERRIDLWFWQVRGVSQTERVWFVYGSFLFYLLIAWFL